MTYTDVKTLFTSILKRRDHTAAERFLFIKLALKAIDRKLRADFMETEATLTIGTDSEAAIPTDYVAGISIYDPAVQDAVTGTYEYKGWRSFQELAADGTRRYYTRRAGKFYFKPALDEDYELTILYFQKNEAPADDNDGSFTSGLFERCPDLVVYQALEYAADEYNDDRLARFQAKAAELMQDAIDDYTSRNLSEGPMSIEPSTDQEF